MHRLEGRLEGRIAWVTGGGRGIGRAIAIEFAPEGAQVAVSSRTRSELDGVVSEIEALGGRGLAVVSDAMSLEGIRAAADTIPRDLGPIDILVNNAAAAPALPMPTGSRPRSWTTPSSPRMSTSICSPPTAPAVP